MTRYLALLLLAPLSTIAAPSTYYIRVDGGTSSQCDGTVDAPYSGNILNRKCAWSNPMFVFPPNIDGGDTKNIPLIKGGDIVMIRAGQYPIGEPFGTGLWDSCKVSNPWDCMMQPIPSGTAANPTQIIGAGSTLTQLWGEGGTSAVVNMTGSNYVLLQGLEITDHSNCIKNHPNVSVKCGPTGAWASNGIQNTNGKASSAPGIPSSFVTLNDLNVHGLAQFGLLVGDINTWTVKNVKVNANGFGGWSTDLSPAYSVSTGLNTFSTVEIAWNGCAENYPNSTIWGCWGQQTGGYGDGFGSSSSSDKGTWSFTDVNVHDNTQDGLDFLHADPSAVITFDRVNAQRNAGNQLKGNGSVSITNSVINGYCSGLAGNGNMVGNNSGGGSTSGDICRALGDAVVIGQSSGHQTSIANSTIISQGNCLITVPDSGIGDNTSTLVIQNNILIGQPVWVDGNQNPPPQSCLYYWNSTNTPTLTNNIVYNVKGNPGTDPKLANETLANFDPAPLPGSPALGKATNGGNIGAIQTAPPQIACSGGIVSAGACYCPVGTTLNAGACGAIPKVCTPTPILSTSGLTTTCSAVCQ